MEFEDLSQELKEKAAQCKTADELAKLVEQEGIELSEGQLEGISGGGWKSSGGENQHCGDPYGVGRC